jgi:GT2 family glycosyltransferase
VHAENCTDGTDEWLQAEALSLGVEYYIDHNTKPKGIGGGMNFCVDKAQSEFVNIIHSDMWIGPNQDLELLKLFENTKSKLIASSFRIQPKIFPTDPDYRPGTVFFPPEAFGEFHYNFNSELFDQFASEFSELNKEAVVRKGGGAGFFCRKKDFVNIGGNDPIFSPSSWEDMDLFIRMQVEGYEFKMVATSVLYHFSARGSHFKEDNLKEKSDRQKSAELANVAKFGNKWGQLPEHDEHTFVKPIYNSGVNSVMSFEENLKYFEGYGK